MGGVSVWAPPAAEKTALLKTINRITAAEKQERKHQQTSSTRDQMSRDRLGQMSLSKLKTETLAFIKLTVLTLSWKLPPPPRSAGVRTVCGFHLQGLRLFKGGLGGSHVQLWCPLLRVLPEPVCVLMCKPEPVRPPSAAARPLRVSVCI